MIIWDKITYLRALFPTKAAAADVARRWYRARTREPDLAADLIRMGGVLLAQPAGPDGVGALDANRLAYEAGRRDLALELLAMMQLTIAELNSLMEDSDGSTLED